MFKEFVKQFFQNIFSLVIKLIGFKSLCWIIATIAYFIDKMNTWEWIAFTSAIIGTKFVKDIKGLYPKLTFKK